jgi:hypothetical protein
MPRRSCALVVPLVLGLGVSCSPSEQPLTPLDDVCAVESGTTIRTAGFLSSPGQMMMCDGETCEMALSNRSAGGSTSIRIDVRLGSGRNAMPEPPDRWSQADLVVTDNEGVERRVGDWVVVQGRILTGGACLITPVSWVLPGEPPGAAGASTSGSGSAAPAAAQPAAPAVATPPAAPADRPPAQATPQPQGDKPGAPPPPPPARKP